MSSKFITNQKKLLSEHKRGRNISTAKRLPVKLIFYEAFSAKKDAERRERYFKTTKGKKTLRLMLREILAPFSCKESGTL